MYQQAVRLGRKGLVDQMRDAAALASRRLQTTLRQAPQVLQEWTSALTIDEQVDEQDGEPRVRSPPVLPPRPVRLSVPERMRRDDEQHGAVILQKVVRGKAERNARVREEAAAIQIAAHVRGRAQRRRLRAQHEAAARIQAIQRGRRDRAELRRLHESAAVLQAWVRARNDRGVVERQRLAAMKMEAFARGRRARQDVKRQADAATRIEAHLRGHIVQARKRRFEQEHRTRAQRRGSLWSELVPLKQLAGASAQHSRAPGCCAELGSAARRWHSALIPCRPHDAQNVDGAWLDGPNRLSEQQGVHIIWTVVAVDLVALAVLNDVEQTLFAFVIGAFADPATQLLILRASKDCAAAICCVLATGLVRALFRAGNYHAWRLTHAISSGKARVGPAGHVLSSLAPRLSADGKHAKALQVSTRSGVRVLVLTWGLSMLLFLGCLTYYVVLTRFYSLPATWRMLQDIGLSTAVAWALLEPLLIVLGVSFVRCRRLCRQACSAEKAPKPAAAPAVQAAPATPPAEAAPTAPPTAAAHPAAAPGLEGQAPDNADGTEAYRAGRSKAAQLSLFEA